MEEQKYVASCGAVGKPREHCICNDTGQHRYCIYEKVEKGFMLEYDGCILPCAWCKSEQHEIAYEKELLRCREEYKNKCIDCEQNPAIPTFKPNENIDN